MNASPPANAVYLASLVTAASMSVDAPAAGSDRHDQRLGARRQGRAPAAAEARSMKRAESAWPSSGHRLNLENHRRELGASTGK